MLSNHLRQFPVAAALQAWNPEAVIGGNSGFAELTLEIAPANLVEVCRFLKHQQNFVRLSDLTAVDWHPLQPRFEVVYHLHCLERNERLRLKCRLGEPAEIDSVTGLWRSADWYEREVWDLFGIRFRHHPDLQRILMPEDWTGHPLRKDYPVHGHRYEYQEHQD